MPYRVTNVTSNSVPIMVLNKDDKKYKQVNLGAFQSIEIEELTSQIYNLADPTISILRIKEI